MTKALWPIIDVHTHIGHLPGVVGDVYHAADLLYIAEHEGASFMLVSSASVTTIGRTVGLISEFIQSISKRLWERMNS